MADTAQANLNGLFKEVYADNIANLLPPSAKLTQTIGFKTGKGELGNQYHQPVILTRPSGFTYGGQGTTSTAYNLNAGKPLQMKDAIVAGTEFTDQELIGYGVMARAANGDKASFMDATSLIIEQIMDTMTFRIELASLYGQSGIGKVASRTTGTATTTTVTLTLASSTMGIWSGLEGHLLNFYNGASNVTATAADQDFEVTGVSYSGTAAVQVVIALSGTAQGITDLNSVVNSNPNVVDVWFKGQYGNEFMGIDKICQLGITALSGPTSIYGITAASYGLWQGNYYDAGGTALSMGKVLSAAGKLVARGLRANAELHANPITWQNLNTDLAALRTYPDQDKKRENGAQDITYHGPVGEIKVVSNIFCKQGEAFLLADPSRAEYWKRVGSTDITFNLPGKTDEFFHNSGTSNGYVLRAYTDQSIFCPVPAKNAKITSIVNN